MNRSPRRAMFITGAVWLAVLVIPPMALWQARGRWLERLERPEAQAAWDEFRRDMAGQTGREGPVQRKVPKSLEPPLRVWLRDYFPLAVIAWMSFAGVAGLLLLVLLWGSAAPAPGGGSGSRSAAPRQDDAGPIPGPRTALESGGDPGAASDAGRVGGRGHGEGLR